MVGDKMEVDEGEGQVIVEGMEVDPSHTRKTEQLYKMDEQKLLKIVPVEVIH